VELSVRRDHARSLAERQRGKEAEDELVGVLGKGDAIRLIAQEAGVPRADPIGLRERPIPLLVRQLRRMQPGLLLSFEPTVRPRLMRVAGEQEAFGDAEARVLRGQGVRGAEELLRSVDHESFALRRHDGHLRLFT
jgi:hypothetical protein